MADSVAERLSRAPEPAAYGRMVEREAGKVLLLTPAEAGRYDPPMQEWLALPVSEDGCPECGGKFWGTTNPVGYFLVRVCHNGCGTKFRGEVTTHTIQRVIEALNGQEVRLAR